MKEIKFNKPYLSNNEFQYISDVMKSGKISGNGEYTRKCHSVFNEILKSHKCLLTTSCTDALEMAAILAKIKYGDEVIMPSYTFVSTANAFILRGAKVIFVDSRFDHPGIDEEKIESFVTTKTKAIVVVHYAGIACDMNKILEIARKNSLYVIEDAAQAFDSYYKNEPLGSIGDMGCFSFHETKNIQCGEGGLLAINNSKFSKRAEIIWEKGTNRSAFGRGEVNKYNWMDIGSSFLPSEINAAFLYAQLESKDLIQKRRKEIWNEYFTRLSDLKNIGISLPNIPEYATNNAHMFFLVCRNIKERTELITFLKGKKIKAVFHYICLHDSPYYKDNHNGRILSNAKKYEECLIRLPLWVGMSDENVKYISTKVLEFFKMKTENE